MSPRSWARGRDSLADCTGGTAACPAMIPTERPETWFRPTRPVWVVIILLLLGYYSWIIFFPNSVPCDELGPIGTFTCYMVENHEFLLNLVYATVWLIHISEALYALKLCRDKGITDPSTQLLWFMQTLLFATFSLYYLLNYNPPKKKRQ